MNNKLNRCGKHWGGGGECSKCRKPDCRTKEGLLAVFNATFYPPEHFPAGTISAHADASRPQIAGWH
jgi:hypothetical protein